MFLKFLAMFKAPEKNNKNNVTVILKIDPKADYMVIDFMQTTNCVRQMQIPLRECRPDLEFSQMKDDKNELQNLIVLPAKAILDCVNQMGRDIEDVSWIFGGFSHF